MCFLKVSREKELDPWHVLLEWISPLRYTNVVVVLASCSLHTPSFELRCRIQRRQQQHAGAGAVQAEHRSSDTKYLLRLSFSLMKLPEIHSNSHQLQHFRHFWIFAMQYQLIGIVNRGGLEACSSRHTVTPEGTIFTGYTTWQCLELSLYIAAHQPDGETWGHGHNVHSRDSGVNSQSVFGRTFKIFLLVPIKCIIPFNCRILRRILQVAEWHEMKWYLICCFNPVYTLSNTCHIFPAITVTISGHPSSAVLLDQPGDHSGGLATNPGNN